MVSDVEEGEGGLIRHRVKVGDSYERWAKKLTDIPSKLKVYKISSRILRGIRESWSLLRVFNLDHAA